MRFLLTLVLFSLFSFGAFAQTKLPVSVDIKIRYLELQAPYDIATKISADGKIGELSYPNGSRITAQVELNSLNVQSLLLRKDTSGTLKYRLSFGSVRFQITNPQAGQIPFVEFEIKVGESVYIAKLHQFPPVATPFLILDMPEEIRIPIDRANTAILKFDDVAFFNESGTFPLMCDFSIESATPQRKTSRR